VYSVSVTEFGALLSLPRVRLQPYFELPTSGVASTKLILINPRIQYGIDVGMLKTYARIAYDNLTGSSGKHWISLKSARSGHQKRVRLSWTAMRSVVCVRDQTVYSSVAMMAWSASCRRTLRSSDPSKHTI
jgi:hypothetical protein